MIYQRFGDKGVLAAQFPRRWRLGGCGGGDGGARWDAGVQFLACSLVRARFRADQAARRRSWWRRPILYSRPPIPGAECGGARARRRSGDVAQHAGGRGAGGVAAAAVHAVGRVVSDATTAYALALAFPLSSQRRTAAFPASGWPPWCGAAAFASAPALSVRRWCDRLVAGAPVAAYRLLLQRMCPSWLYSVTMGATEQSGSVGTACCRTATSTRAKCSSSSPAYALGAVADWLHRTVAGLAPAAPGFRRIEMRAIPGGS